MKNLFFLEALCGKHKKVFYPRYDLGADDYWVLTYGVKTLPPGHSSEGAQGPGINIPRRRVGPQYKCPHCGNTDFVRCGRCHKLTCNPDGANSFTCAHCGNTGKITGTISVDDMKGMVKSSGSGQ